LKKKSQYITYGLICIGCLGLLAWLYAFSPLRFINYPAQQLPPGTYCYGDCPGWGSNANPSGTGAGMVAVGFFELVGVLCMLVGVIKRDSSLLRSGVITSLVFAGLYALFFWTGVL
jgi:hypothetical protein